ncbi:MAG: 2-iminoacetate synthase ThiH [Butyrivibrio sp.]|uniref:2-iminoacetate synthase ThiH n=1 Tax=Butyrivibrio sp. TaxID=28121 RepID=UPI0025DDD9DF|nr:2-iminoacetate synthase ThiH [Butyrivibrio sp.]MCR5770932.1 2-iminoacetate synthase ThiH [Butyrivibrio sp.]
MNEENQIYFIDSDKLPEEVIKRKHRLEQDPSFRTNHMEYMEGMEIIKSDIKDKVIDKMNNYDYSKYTGVDVINALSHKTCSIEDFKALLSPAAAPFLEKMARKATLLTEQHFGNTVYIFTPLYIANYCQNYCVYCGFNCYNNIKRKKLTLEEIDHEMSVIAQTGMEEILMLTGESRRYSDIKYIGEALKIAKKYFRNIGIEIYPVNTDEYKYLHECGADYVTVFQETYNSDKYETLHLLGHKRVWPYRFDAQERALKAGMRGAGFSALLGLDDFRKDALASALHVYYINRKYPHAELSLSCPRLRPIVNNDKINPRDVGEKELCQVLCAYRIFLPYVGITVSSRESAAFRNGIAKICATKVSAGVSTGIGDHKEKYDDSDDTGHIDVRREAQGDETAGDEQFEISDNRSIDRMMNDMENGGLQPVLNDYVYV